MSLRLCVFGVHDAANIYTVHVLQTVLSLEQGLAVYR